MWRWRETFFTLITIARKKFKDKAIVFTSASLLNYIIQCNLHVSTIKCICEQSDPITTKGTYACFDYNKEIKEQTTVPISREKKYPRKKRENKYSFTKRNIIKIIEYRVKYV